MLPLPTVLVYLELKDVLRCGTASAKTGKVLGELGKAGLAR